MLEQEIKDGPDLCIFDMEIELEVLIGGPCHEQLGEHGIRLVRRDNSPDRWTSLGDSPPNSTDVRDQQSEWKTIDLSHCDLCPKQKDSAQDMFG